MNRFMFALSLLLSATVALNFCVAISTAESRLERSDRVLPNVRQTSASVRTFLNQQAVPAATPKTMTRKTSNAVCGNPEKPCQHKQKNFDDWELSFQMPVRLSANKIYRSAPFYAVIVKKYDGGCEDLDVNPAVEPERIRLQKHFPTRKVFAGYSCPNLSAVSYDFSGRLSQTGEADLYSDYIVVYAGETVEQANELSDELLKEFSQAEVKKMTASFELIEQ